MKTIKAHIINEEGDLVMGFIDVPVTDPRPAYNPATDVKKADKLQAGNPMANARDGVKAGFQGSM